MSLEGEGIITGFYSSTNQSYVTKKKLCHLCLDGIKITQIKWLKWSILIHQVHPYQSNINECDDVFVQSSHVSY